MQGVIWLALGYNVPANPSKGRVYVWRRLKELGAGYFRPGVAILPKTVQSMAAFRALSDKILAMGGEATIAELKFCDYIDESDTIQRFLNQSLIEYDQLLKDCQGQRSSDEVRQAIRRYGKVRSRDHFKVAGNMGIGAALSDLANDIGDLDKQLRAILEQ